MDAEGGGGGAPPSARPWAARLLDLVYPPRCLVCDRDFPPAGSPLLCPACAAGFVPLADPHCPRCAQSLGPHTLEAFECPNCHGRTLPFEWATACGRYEGTLRDALHRLKFLGSDLLARPLAERLAQAVRQRDLDARWDAVVPVPPSQPFRWLRPRNPAEILARELARALALPVAVDALRKARATPPQTELDRRRRLANQEGAMVVPHPAAVKDRAILIVDDILTTGATAAEAARSLRAAGARSCHVAVVAR